MPRKNKHTTKHRVYVKPDYHSQNTKQCGNDDNVSNKKKKKKNKLRRSYDIYKRLLHDPSLGIDLNNVYIGYSDIDNVKEMTFLDWKMIDDGGDIAIDGILYFVLYLMDKRKIIIWDKKTKLDRLYCSGERNKNSESLKSLLSEIKRINISPKVICKQYDDIKPYNKAIMILNGLISRFNEFNDCDININDEEKENMNMDNNKKIGILFMGGSFNPIHCGHIELMVVIKKYFELNHNINIIGGYLVITTDKYVLSKLKNEAISFIHRKKLCELMCNDNNNLNWLYPSKYAHSSSIQYLQKEFLNKYPNALMINCMGSDKILIHRKKGRNGTGKWRKYSKNINNRKCLTVCIKRKGHCENAYNLYLKDVENGLVKSNAFMFINVNVKPLSSTLIRNILKKYKKEILNENENENILKKYKQELKGYLNEESIHYLLNNINNIWMI